MCNRAKVFVRGRDYEHERVIMLDTQCGCYSCAQCRVAIRKMHQARIIYATKEHQETSFLKWSFVTLTAPAHIRGIEDSVKLFRCVLDKWHKRMRRRYGQYPYVLVYERHKSGCAHVHLLMGACVSKKHVKRNAKAVGLGYICDVRRLYAPAAAGAYVAKYLSKSLGEQEFPKRMKRVCYSHNFPALPRQNESPIKVWDVLPKSEALYWAKDALQGQEGLHVDKYLLQQMRERHPHADLSDIESASTMAKKNPRAVSAGVG